MILALPFLAAAGLCLVAMLPGLPYGYFMLLRCAVAVVGLYGSVRCFERKMEGWAWGCIALSVLFNPLIKIHLGRELWWWLDGAAAVFLVMVSTKVKTLEK